MPLPSTYIQIAFPPPLPHWSQHHPLAGSTAISSRSCCCCPTSWSVYSRIMLTCQSTSLLCSIPPVILHLRIIKGPSAHSDLQGLPVLQARVLRTPPLPLRCSASCSLNWKGTVLLRAFALAIPSVRIFLPRGSHSSLCSFQLLFTSEFLMTMNGDKC